MAISKICHLPVPSANLTSLSCWTGHRGYHSYLLMVFDGIFMYSFMVYSTPQNPVPAMIQALTHWKPWMVRAWTMQDRWKTKQSFVNAECVQKSNLSTVLFSISVWQQSKIWDDWTHPMASWPTPQEPLTKPCHGESTNFLAADQEKWKSVDLKSNLSFHSIRVSQKSILSCHVSWCQVAWPQHCMEHSPKATLCEVSMAYCTSRLQLVHIPCVDIVYSYDSSEPSNFFLASHATLAHWSCGNSSRRACFHAIL